MQIEILAPAGSVESLTAAVRCGANAVYLGTKNFNARRNADNFDGSALKSAVEYCHQRNVKVYLTANTLVADDEMSSAYNTIKTALEYGVDAFIVQDLGVAKMIRQCFPSARLHASTQCSVNTPDGVNALKELGFKRIVVPREMSLDEIKEIREKTDVELEMFVHGALCMCVSGQCYMSAMLGGRSGNRGLCAQPCRLSFSADNSGSFDLSLKDLSLIDKIKEIESAGIISLKIEGRMKSILYVATVVNAYRMALDGCDMELVMNELNRISHRPYTTGFMLDNDAMGSKAPLMAPESGGYIQDYAIAAVVLDYDSERKIAHVEQRNRFFDGDELHILAPKDVARAFRVNGIRSEEGEIQQSAPHPCQKLYIGCSEPVAPGSILRVAAKKNPVFSA